MEHDALGLNLSITGKKEWQPLTEGKQSDLHEEDMERGLDPSLLVAFETCSSAYTWSSLSTNKTHFQELRSNCARVNITTATDQVDD